MNDLKIKEYSLSSDLIEIYRQNFIAKIVKCYEAFSFVEPKQTDSFSTGLFDKNNLVTLRLKNNLQEADKLIQAFYAELTNKNSTKDINTNKPEIFLQFLSKTDIKNILALTKQPDSSGVRLLSRL